MHRSPDVKDVPVRHLPPHRDPSAGHDHGTCVATLLDRARQQFDARGLKLTALRMRVLAEIADSHDAMGAYALIERLALKTGAKLAPVSVYRAIDALLAVGLVHRLESRNAFFACHAPHQGQQPHIALVCETCTRVVEVAAGGVYGLMAEAASGCGFQLQGAVAEGSGVCARCQGSRTATDEAEPPGGRRPGGKS